MPTPAERRALLFLGGLIIMGGGVRAARAVGRHGSEPDSASVAALDRQLAAVDSAREAREAREAQGARGSRRSRVRSAGGPGARGTRGRAATADTGGGGGGRAPSGGKGGGTGATRPAIGPGSGVASEPAPGPEVYYVAPRREKGAGRGAEPHASGAGRPLGGGERVDLDRAPPGEIERLPRIGPVLARRIVADRDSLGPFGSLQALGRVRGVGAAMLRILAPYVTFSSPPRQSGVDDRGGERSRSRRRARRVKPP